MSTSPGRTIATLTALAALAGPAVAVAAKPVRVTVLSSRADLVSGGNALVRIVLPARSDLGKLSVKLGAKDVTKAFARRPDGQVEGLVSGIGNRKVQLVARVRGKGGARLTITGHPNGGPLIAGPQLQPWICQDDAVDQQCNQPVKYELKAKTSNGFVDYDPQSPPEDMEQTTTSDGRTVPFVVRVETGYQDRDQYKVAVLYDPKKPWQPWKPQAGWNRRLVLVHGGSCGTDRKAGTAPDVLNAEVLGKGFMVGSTALNNLGHNCNPVVIVESELMLRERIVERYGPVRATLGSGCSGGSIAQLMAAHAYPGFYDGVTVQCTFADLLTTGRHGVSGHLFKNFFATPMRDGLLYTSADWAAVNGSPLAQGDDGLFDAAFWPYISGENGCGGLPADQPRWSEENPSGIRCGVLDHNVNVLGRGPNGYAGVPLDNIGIQYGLKALESGALTVEKFVDLNANIGGLDKASYKTVPARTQADPSALGVAYRTGYMAIGNTLDRTPILEGRGPNETTAHVTYPTLALNARLDREHGSHANHVVWQGPVPLYGQNSYANRMIFAMDRWVAAIQKDRRGLSRAKKIVADKPADIVNHCEATDGQEQPGTDCPDQVRFYNSPTQVAGESQRNDVLKCQLKPLRREDYSVTFTDAQFQTLQQTFPTGVCDWSKPGVGEGPTIPWLTYAAGPGGRPLGAAPVSKPL